MNKNHTPGPWVYYYEQIGNQHIVWSDNSRIVSLSMNDDAESNARLIAAAPDLLAVLQDLQESAGYWSEYDVPIGIVDRINAAIAKAAGGAA